MTTNYYDEDHGYIPQSHDELDVDYELIPPQWRIIIAIILILALVGTIILGIVLK